MRKIVLFALLTWLAIGAVYRGEVLYVIDGDTIYGWVEGFGKTKVRLIGIDAPEMEYGKHALRQTKRWHKNPEEVYSLGWKAKLYLRGLLPKHTRVKIETDVELFDDYGRLLGYVWKGDTLTNELMVKEGYAAVYTFPPNVKYVERFIKAQKEARRNHKGIWSLFRKYY